MDSIKKEFILEKLGCASCAAKMENQINALENINNATIDFVSKKLVLETNEDDVNNIIDEVKKIVTKIEPDVKVVTIDKSNETKKKVDKNEDDENKKNLIKIIISAVLFAAGLILKLPEWATFSIFFVGYLVIGEEVLLRALKNILKGQVFDENFLMSIATIGAFVIGEYPEGIAVMLFYQIGELFQDLAVDRSRKSISDLMDIRPDYANLKIGDEIKQVSPEEVKIKDIVIVKPGEKIPLDGVIIEGNSMVDTSSLTGESVPREVGTSNDVLSGFINKNGVLTISVTKEFGESTVAKILDLVENASSKKAPTEKFITKFARYYTPVVVITALLLAVLPPLVIKDAAFSDWGYRALIFLVISCPCALVISIPLGFFGGIGGASKRGILVKGSNYLEALNNVDTVVFDKTGTLTKGVFNVTDIIMQNEFTRERLLEIAAYAESFSNHPIATSILKAYGKEIDRSIIEDYDELTGYGIKVKVDGKEILAGNVKLMIEENIDYSKTDSIGTVVHISQDGIYAGCIIISDEVKEDSKLAVKELKNIGVSKTVMLTGDLKTVGNKVGKELGIDEVYSELLPADKVEKLEEINSVKSPKGKLVFVGDGINDAPVLARADIGMAMGGLGSDAAIEAADIVIMTDEPSKIAMSIKIAKRTNKIVWENIIFAIGIKIVFLALGAFGLTSMWQAVFADVGVAVIAILNSMRAMNVKKI
ncbi:heavy metal translocating P-type ATPase [Sedimentibacter sp. MB31-C6]|uniref:heavy metal translocating P-type ATPase n=1 Tax=Sedimentibacter sp. MB31-C6 TaxID=3109366 RepID=UPI002DDD5599|nr:heavy metal translocating P-type ATPase [Sedimentibacter sp. MB36-C1]WSI02980.1 heavy metal translocating P-type ATPase [Sedimentibacter sp. MB36-C1]